MIVKGDANNTFKVVRPYKCAGTFLLKGADSSDYGNFPWYEDRKVYKGDKLVHPLFIDSDDLVPGFTPDQSGYILGHFEPYRNTVTHTNPLTSLSYSSGGNLGTDSITCRRSVQPPLDGTFSKKGHTSFFKYNNTTESDSRIWPNTYGLTIQPTYMSIPHSTISISFGATIMSYGVSSYTIDVPVYSSNDATMYNPSSDSEYIDDTTLLNAGTFSTPNSTFTDSSTSNSLQLFKIEKYLIDDVFTIDTSKPYCHVYFPRIGFNITGTSYWNIVVNSMWMAIHFE